jgi:K+-transporting ATPase KdpF subunit
MNTKFLLAIVPLQPKTVISDSQVSYLIGGIIALFIMGYLIYTLIRPEKF